MSINAQPCRAELARLPLLDAVSGKDSRTSSALRILLMLALMLAPAFAFAQASDPTPLQFQDAAQESRFHGLTAELRCVMCQNQSLADSNAQIAHDLRREVLALMNDGKSDAEIKRFLVDRYGEFVLYKPEVSRGTWLLWFGPLLLLLAGAAVVFRLLRKRTGETPVTHDDNQEW
jgi:cytochrome c-type biogenesis protein CcmH